MAKLHPIAAKYGFQTNEDFYKKFPTKESFEMAMGGENSGSKFFYQDAGPVLNNTRAQDSLKFAQSRYNLFHNVNLAKDRGDRDFTRPRGPADKLEEQMNKDLIYFKNKYNSLPYETKCHPSGWCPPNPSDPNSTEHYHKAEGGSPYIGQPTYAEFLHFGPQTKQVPFYNVGGNVDLFLRETKKSLMPAAKTGMQTKGITPTSTNEYLAQRNKYVFDTITNNTQRGLLNEVHNEISNELKYGGLPKAEIGADMLSMYDKGMQAFKDSEAQREGQLTRTIEERQSGIPKADIALGITAGASNFFNAPENLASEEFKNIHRISDYTFPEKKLQNRGNWKDGVQLGYNFRPEDLSYSQGRDWGLNRSKFGGDQFGGFIQYDTEGNQMLPMGLSGLQVKMNPGLGNSSYNGNQLAWPFHPDVMSAPPVRSRRDLTAVPRGKANVEAEGGETVVTNFNDDGIPEHYNIKGPRHTHGGVPLSLPDDSFIFSDTAKMKIKDPTILAQFGMPPKKGGYTPAEIAKKYDINKFKKVLMDPNSDEMQIATAEKMISDYNLKLAKLALIQESMKGFPQGIPEIAKPYLAQLNIDPNMFFGQEEEQAEQNPQVAEGEAEEADEEQMAYGGIPTARNGRAGDYFNRAMYNLNPYYNMDYYNSYAYTGMRPGMYRQPSSEYHYSSNDPRASKAAMNRPEDLPDFLKYKNVQSIDYKHERPGAVKRFFGTPTVTTATYKFGPGQQAPGTSNVKTQTQSQTQPTTNTSQMSPQQVASRVSPDARQQAILNAANPFGPYNNYSGPSIMDDPTKLKGQGVNQNLYDQGPVKDPNMLNEGIYAYGGIPMAQPGRHMENGRVALRKRQPAPVKEPIMIGGYDTDLSPAGDFGIGADYLSGIINGSEWSKDIQKLIPFVGEDANMGEWMQTLFNLPQKSITAITTGVYDKPGNVYKEYMAPRIKERGMPADTKYLPGMLNFGADPLLAFGTLKPAQLTGRLTMETAKDIAKVTGLTYAVVANAFKKYGPKAIAYLKGMVKNPAAIDRLLYAGQKALTPSDSGKSGNTPSQNFMEQNYSDSTKVAPTKVKANTTNKAKQDTGVTYTRNDINKLVGKPGYEGYTLEELMDYYKKQGINIKD